MEIKAVLFDADNTLYDTRGLARLCDKEAMKVLAPAKPEAALVEFYAIVDGLKRNFDPSKRTRLQSYSMLAKKFGAGDAEAKKAVEHFQKSFLSKLKPKAGTKKMLEILKKKGLLLAVVTAEEREWALKKLDASNLSEYFKVVITADDVGRMKPDARYFRLAMENLDVSPDECLVIGDDEEGDLKPARALGMAAERESSILLGLLLP